MTFSSSTWSCHSRVNAELQKPDRIAPLHGKGDSFLVAEAPMDETGECQDCCRMKRFHQAATLAGWVLEGFLSGFAVLVRISLLLLQPEVSDAGQGKACDCCKDWSEVITLSHDFHEPFAMTEVSSEYVIQNESWKHQDCLPNPNADEDPTDVPGPPIIVASHYSRPSRS